MLFLLITNEPGSPHCMARSLGVDRSSGSGEHGNPAPQMGGEREPREGLEEYSLTPVHIHNDRGVAMDVRYIIIRPVSGSWSPPTPGYRHISDTAILYISNEHVSHLK